jgi:fucose 4-O-acetylase-like acetyltransferase
MSHTGVDVIDFLFYTIYPVIGIFLVEVISRAVKAPKWIKLWVQAAVSIGFGIYYWFILPAPQNFPLTALVMFALAIALIYQGKRAKISPDKSPY